MGRGVTTITVMDWLERAAKLRQWSRDGVRAPHKPLLLLYALGRFQADAADELPYSAVESDLKQLLVEYGPPRGTTPAYPFHHLVSDGVWEVRTAHSTGSPGTGVRELRASRARWCPAEWCNEPILPLAGRPPTSTVVQTGQQR